MPNTVHVYPADGKWAVKLDPKSGREVFSTQREAIRKARDIAAQHSPSQVVVLGADGSILRAIPMGFPKVYHQPTKSARARKLERAVGRLALERITAGDHG